MKRFTFWAVTLAVLLIVVFNVQGWLVFARTSRVLEHELGDRLQAIAVTLAMALGPVSADSLSAQAGVLQAVLDGNRLLNAFLVNDRLEYVANVREPDAVGGEDDALGLDVAEVLAAFSGVPTQARLYQRGDVFLKSAFAPVYDGSGLPVAVVGVEADADFFAVIAGFRDSLLLVNTLSLLAIAVIIVLSATLARHALRVEQAASRANTLALMGQMSAAVAHEIKNPLGIIRASAERLRKKYGGAGSPGAGDPTFGYIEEEVDRLARVVSNYLGLGRYKPGDLEQLVLDEIVMGAVGDLDHEARRAGVTVEAKVGDLPGVRGNRNEVRQALLNILLNAIQAQPDGGRVEVAAVAAERRGRRWVRVSVRDHGPGIPARVRARLFEPFFTTREKGSGLGLFVVKRIVEGHGGRVRVESRPDGGTVVSMELPA